MKIALTPDVVASLKTFLESIKTHNEFVPKRLSPLVNAILIDVYTHQDSLQVERIAKGIISPQARKKALLKRLEKLAELLGEDSVARLERSANRTKKLTTSISENDA